jgi:Predicted membrane protein
MKCPTCQAEINDDSKFCNECGAQIELAATTENSFSVSQAPDSIPDTTPQYSKQCLITKILIAFLILALGIGGYLYKEGNPFVTPKNVVDDFLLAVEKADFQTAGQYVVQTSDITTQLNKANTPEGEKMVKAIFPKVSHKIISSTKNGATAQVITSITSPDLLRITSSVIGQLMPVAFASAFSQNADKENINQLAEQYFMNAITDPNAPMTTNEVTINLKKQDGKWLIIPDDDLSNALTGNIGKLALLGNNSAK